MLIICHYLRWSQSHNTLLFIVSGLGSGSLLFHFGSSDSKLELLPQSGPSQLPPKRKPVAFVVGLLSTRADIHVCTDVFGAAWVSDRFTYVWPNESPWIFAFVSGNEMSPVGLAGFWTVWMCWSDPPCGSATVHTRLFCWRHCLHISLTRWTLQSASDGSDLVILLQALEAWSNFSPNLINPLLTQGNLMMRAKIRRKGKRYTSCSVFQPTLSPDVQLCVLYVSHSGTHLCYMFVLNVIWRLYFFSRNETVNHWFLYVTCKTKDHQ